MSLDQTLTEIEPVFRETDGGFTFSHPSFQEVLTTKQFADEINSGQLSVRDAYVNFWSYEEDAELWDLPKDREWRALLPDWENVLLFLYGLLTDRLQEELIQLITDKHFETRNKYKRNVEDYWRRGIECIIPPKERTTIELEDYHPFLEEKYFASKLIARSYTEESIRTHLDKLTKDIFNKSRRELYMINLWETALEYYPSLATDMPYDMKCKLTTEYDQRIMEREKIKRLIMEPFDAKPVDSLIEYILDKSNSGRNYAIEALGKKIGHDIIPFLFEYMSNNPDCSFSDIHQAAKIVGAQALGVMIQFLKDKTKQLMDIKLQIDSGQIPAGDTKFKAEHIESGLQYCLDEIWRLGDRETIVELYHFKNIYHDKYIGVTDVHCDSAIRNIHQRLKPQGYNPLIKRLVQQI